MCTNSDSKIKFVLGKRIYEILKLSYLEKVRDYIKTHKSIDLNEIFTEVALPADIRLGKAVIDGQVLEVTRRYLNMNGIDMEAVRGDDGYIYFRLASIIEDKNVSYAPRTKK